MSKIEMMEVNQHTSDEVAKVLADLEAQGVDIAALQTALTAQGTNINTILQKVQNSGGGLTSCVRKVQFGCASIGRNSSTFSVTLSGFTNAAKMVPILGVAIFNFTGSVKGVTVTGLTTSALNLGGDIYHTEKSGYIDVPYVVIEFY